MENKKNILEYVSTQIAKAIEDDKQIVQILLDTNHDMIELNKKIDKILEKWEEK